MVGKHLTAVLAGVALAFGAANAEWVMLDRDGVTSIYPAGQHASGVLLSCNAEGRFSLAVALEGSDMPRLVEMAGRRERQRSGRLIVGGTEVFEGWFRYRPATQIAETSDPGAAVKIFNAVVQGQPVRFDLTSKDAVDVRLPPVDDAFRRFAAECRDPMRAYRSRN